MTQDSLQHQTVNFLQDVYKRQLPTQHKLGILQGLVVEKPVQLCPLCRGVAVFVLHVWRMAPFQHSVNEKENLYAKT